MGGCIEVKRFGLAALLSLFLLSALVGIGLCQGVSVGVAEGDYFFYDYFIDGDQWIVSELFPEVYEFFQTRNATDWERREVTAVSGTVITFNVTTGYVNGSEANRIVDFNMTSSHDFWVIGAELEAGEQAGTLADQTPLYINETVQVEYGDETRDVNTVRCWYEQWGNRSIWWDRPTGALVKDGVSFGFYNLETGDEFYVNSWQLLSDTNRWVVPEFPTGTAMALVFVAVTVCVDVYRRRKRLG
jgi:hypothetical protein